ncbi:hypothetical protein ABK040_011994 [Willaertia magna]
MKITTRLFLLIANFTLILLLVYKAKANINNESVSHNSLSRDGTSIIQFFTNNGSATNEILNIGKPPFFIEIIYNLQEETSVVPFTLQLVDSNNNNKNVTEIPITLQRKMNSYDSEEVFNQVIFRLNVTAEEFNETDKTLLVKKKTQLTSSITLYISILSVKQEELLTYEQQVQNDFFPGIYLYSSFVGLTLVGCCFTGCIWCFVYRKRKNPAALGERSRRIVKHTVILLIALCLYFLVFLGILSAPIFSMNRQLTKCCNYFPVLINSTAESSITKFVNGYSEIPHCKTIVEYQHLFWFLQDDLTNQQHPITTNNFACLNDHYYTILTYHYNYIIWSVIFGVLICFFCIPIHFFFTIYFNKLLMLFKKQHTTDNTIRFHVQIINK